MARTFTGLKLQGSIGKFGNEELSDVSGYLDLPDGKVECCTTIAMRRLLYHIVHIHLLDSDAHVGLVLLRLLRPRTQDTASSMKKQATFMKENRPAMQRQSHVISHCCMTAMHTTATMSSDVLQWQYHTQ